MFPSIIIEKFNQVVKANGSCIAIDCGKGEPAIVGSKEIFNEFKTLSKLSSYCIGTDYFFKDGKTLVRIDLPGNTSLILEIEGENPSSFLEHNQSAINLLIDMFDMYFHLRDDSIDFDENPQISYEFNFILDRISRDLFENMPLIVFKGNFEFVRINSCWGTCFQKEKPKNVQGLLKKITDCDPKDRVLLSKFFSDDPDIRTSFYVCIENVWYLLQKIAVSNPNQWFIIIGLERNSINDIKKSLIESNEAQITAFQLLQAKNHFISLAAEQLSTPLNAISASSKIIKENLTNKIVLNQLNCIEESCDTLLRLVKDMVELCDTESNYFAHDTQIVLLPKILNTICEMAETILFEKDVEIGLLIEKNVPLIVKLNELKFIQILTNIVGNACRLTENGEVVIRVFLAKKQDNECELLFEIQDTSAGIPPEDINRLYEPFFQICGPNKQHNESGLGLAISKSFVEKIMNGRIWVESKLGVGTKVSFTIKCKVEKKSALVGQFSFGKIDMISQCDSEMESSKICLDTVLYHWFDKKSPDSLLIVYMRQNSATIEESLRKAATHILLVHDRNLTAKIQEKYPECLLCSKPVTSYKLSVINKTKIQATEGFNPRSPFQGVILVVNDNPIIIKVMERYFNLVHVRYDFAMDGYTAIEKCKENVYDVVLIDSYMNGLSGIETAHGIKDLNLTKTPALLAMTADPSFAESPDSSVFYKILNKPLDFSYFSSLLSQIN